MSIDRSGYAGSDFALNQATLIEKTPRTETRFAPDFLLQKFPKWTIPHWCVLVFAVSFVLLTLFPEGRLNEFEVPNAAETARVARSLAAHGTFANPFVTLQTGPTAHVAPVYPFLYSLIIRLFGTGRAAVLVAWAFNVACLALQMALLPLVSYRLNRGILPGIIAAALGTFSLYAPIDTRWECFLAGTLLLLAYRLTDRALQNHTLTATLTVGVVWGVAFLTNPVAVLLLVAWLFCFLWSPYSQTRPERLRRSLSIIGVALLVMSLWVVRNYLRFDAFIFVRDNIGLELYTGNNDCASPDLRANIESGCHARTHPNPNAAIAAQLAAAGEVPFYRAKLHEALSWVRAHPIAFARLTAQRFALFWLPRADHAWESILVAIITLLSIPGLWLIARSNRCGACAIAATWLLFPLVYYLVPFEPRYRYPIYWTTLLPAACLLTELFRRIRTMSSASQ